MRTVKKSLITLVAALSASFGLAACADGDGHDADHPSSRIADSEEFNQADVDFATDMIPHHAQALLMVDLVDDGSSPELTALAEQIRMAQGPEIETMVDWLTDWGQPVPETMRDHANAHSDDEMPMDSDMPGMVSAEDLDDLDAARGEDFERMWLQMMIEHHEGAIEMARDEKADGEYADARDLAAMIIETQQSEIDTMEGLLDR
jgi:uncharacterized protein (DUF305 family)